MTVQAAIVPMKRPAWVEAMLIVLWAGSVIGSAPALANPMPVTHDAYDAIHYELAIDVGDSTIAGELTLYGRALWPDLSEIVLDLADELTVDQVTSATHTIQSTDHRAREIRILLSPALAVGDSFTVSVAYHGTPPADVPSAVDDPPFRWHYHEHQGVRTPVIFTMSVPDRSWAWWPCKETLGDKATIDVAATVAEGMTAVSNGVLQGSEPQGEGRVTWRWSHGHPVAPYLVSLAISDFHVIERSAAIVADGDTITIPLQYYVYQEDSTAAVYDFGRVGEMIQMMTDLFGPYPFADERYAIATVPTGGGMEHQTCTTLGGRYITGTRSQEWVVIHELSHQWWGDWVGLADWRDVWLNEGFATYCEALWVEHTQDRSAYLDYMQELDSFAPPVGADFSGTVYDPAQLYGPTPYRKGAWVLHMLRHLVGDDELFFGALRAYREQQGGRGESRTEDFQQVMEQETGVDLDAFLAQWLYETGRPHYAWSWEYVPAAGGFDVSLDLTQVQSGFAPYTMPIDLRIDTTTGPQLIAIENTASAQSFTFTVPAEPRALTFDPEGWVLKPTVPAATGVLQLSVPRPNPTRGDSRITYDVPAAGVIDLHVHDLTGRRVRTLVDGRYQGGEHSVAWDGRDDDGRPLAGGVYYLRLSAPGGAQRRTLVMVR